MRFLLYIKNYVYIMCKYIELLSIKYTWSFHWTCQNDLVLSLTVIKVKLRSFCCREPYIIHFVQYKVCIFYGRIYIYITTSHKSHMIFPLNLSKITFIYGRKLIWIFHWLEGVISIPVHWRLMGRGMIQSSRVAHTLLTNQEGDGDMLLILVERGWSSENVLMDRGEE